MLKASTNCQCLFKCGSLQTFHTAFAPPSQLDIVQDRGDARGFRAPSYKKRYQKHVKYRTPKVTNALQITNRIQNESRSPLVECVNYLAFRTNSRGGDIKVDLVTRWVVKDIKQKISQATGVSERRQLSISKACPPCIQDFATQILRPRRLHEDHEMISKTPASRVREIKMNNTNVDVTELLRDYIDTFPKQWMWSHDGVKRHIREVDSLVHDVLWLIRHHLSAKDDLTYSSPTQNPGTAHSVPLFLSHGIRTHACSGI